MGLDLLEELALSWDELFERLLERRLGAGGIAAVGLGDDADVLLLRRCQKVSGSLETQLRHQSEVNLHAERGKLWSWFWRSWPSFFNCGEVWGSGISGEAACVPGESSRIMG